MNRVVLLTSSGLTDRILAYSRWLAKLDQHVSVHTWATSAGNAASWELWKTKPGLVEDFPKIRPYKEFPINFLRRLNEFSWDYYFRDPSRMSMLRHFRDKAKWYVRMLALPGRVISALNWQHALEERLEHAMLRFNRSPEAELRLRELDPDLVVSTGTFRYFEPAISGVAKELGIPVMAFITSWDNLSIKSRMVFRYDGYLVWSERMKQELAHYYPGSRNAPVYVVGAPQFDVFFQRQRFLTRDAFCAGLNLIAARPIILHALGVANGVEEHHGALDLARRVVRGELGDAQLIVRPHPFNNQKELRSLFREYAPRVVVQQNHIAQKESGYLPSEDEINQWVNTFRHSDVVVHLSSTAAIDAAIAGRPSVCMDYDPTPGQPKQKLVKDVNHRWTHYRPVAESGGTWLVGSVEELLRAVRAYLANPSMHAAEREEMARYVCGFVDGRCGERASNAILDFAERTKHDRRTVGLAR